MFCSSTSSYSAGFQTSREYPPNDEGTKSRYSAVLADSESGSAYYHPHGDEDEEGLEKMNRKVSVPTGTGK